jgi:hypothetical protein
VRYGEAISEHGFGGQTTGHDGDVQQGGYGRKEKYKENDAASQTGGSRDMGGVQNWRIGRG